FTSANFVFKILPYPTDISCRSEGIAMNRNIGVFFLILLASSLGFSQTVKEASTPLGDTLTRALTKSVLSSGDAKPFHIRVSLAESTNPSSEYHAQIEEYWGA